MAHFVKNIVLFLLPLALAFIFPLLVFTSAGEFYTLANVERLADGETLLFAPAYSNFLQQYKFEMTAERRPQVLALGSSRVGLFRAAFFKDHHIFYNATGGTLAFSDFNNFVDGLTDKPAIIIAGMDQYFFNPDRPIDDIVVRPDPFDTTVSGYEIALEGLFRQGGWWKVYVDWIEGKFSLMQLFSPHTLPTRVGLRAYTDEGHTNDGSQYFGNVVADLEKQTEIRSDIEALASSISDTEGSEYGDRITPEALLELRLFLEECKGQGVFVIGFLPPVSHAVYTALLAHPNATYAHTFKTLPAVLAGIYREYGFDFYDYSDPASVGGSDAEMAEAKHGSEKLYLRMTIDMARRSSTLAPLVDVSFLERQLQAATSSYSVFGIE